MMALKNYSYFFLTVTIIWALDFFTKLWAVSALQVGMPLPVIDNFVNFVLIYNTGGVFGIFQGNAMLFQALTGTAMFLLLIYFLKTPDTSRLFQLAVAFILGGALGNFTDRFFRPGVADFIDMGIGSFRWPTYNVADVFITLGAIILAIAFYLIEKKRARQTDSAR